MRLISAAQLKKIAIGLKQSEQKFFRVVHSLPIEDKTKRFLAPPEPDFTALLPQGFLDRTKLKRQRSGSEVMGTASGSAESWICDSLWMELNFGSGVCRRGDVAWPLYAEQRVNRVFLVKEGKLSLPMEEAADGFVSAGAGEVEKQVRQLMESDEGKAVREQAMRMKEGSKTALSEGCLPVKALSELAYIWMQ